MALGLLPFRQTVRGLLRQKQATQEWRAALYEGASVRLIQTANQRARPSVFPSPPPALDVDFNNFALWGLAVSRPLGYG